MFLSFYSIPTDTDVLGDLLLRNLLKALAMKAKHTATREKFNAVIHADLRQEWTEMISRWEQDKTQPNPYTHTEKGVVCCFAMFGLSR